MQYLNLQCSLGFVAGKHHPLKLKKNSMDVAIYYTFYFHLLAKRYSVCKKHFNFLKDIPLLFQMAEQP